MLYVDIFYGVDKQLELRVVILTEIRCAHLRRWEVLALEMLLREHSCCGKASVAHWHEEG